MYINHWVTSDVQIRKGALIPPFWVGLGWADFWVQIASHLQEKALNGHQAF
jgi:hypothetical protein